ncbi:MAG TPA: hypothetical protein VGQ83_07785 [Polyangia bacterium]
MVGPGAGAAAVLCRAILDDARAEGEVLVAAAREQAGALLAQAAADAAQGRDRRLDEARAEAARRAAAILATVPVEAGRLRAARIEAVLGEIHDEARRRLVAGDGGVPAETLVALAAEALARMEGDAFVLRLRPGARLDVDEVRRRAGRPGLELTALADPAVADGGLIVEDAAGRQVWDDRLAARLERLWPELRRRLVAAIGGGP